MGYRMRSQGTSKPWNLSFLRQKPEGKKTISHQLKELISKVAQEFEKRVNKFSDLGVVPGRHEWYVILRKNGWEMTSGIRSERVWQKNMIKNLRIVYSMLFLGKRDRFEENKLSTYLNYSLKQNRGHLSGHKLYSYNKDYTLVTILWLICRKPGFFLQVSTLSIMFYSHLFHSNGVLEGTQYL